MGEARQLCTFLCESRLFGLDIHRMREVVRYQTPTLVPLSTSEVRGLMSFRGQIIPVIDLGTRLDLPTRPKTKLPVNLILEMPEIPIALTVDSVEDVITIDAADVLPPPQNLPILERSLVEGVYQIPDQLIVILDADAIVSSPVRSSTR